MVDTLEEHMLKTRMRGRAGALLALWAVAGCDAGSSGNPDALATAGGLELTIEEAATLLAAQPQLPAQADVVEALAELWVDYSLLGLRAAADPTLRSIDIEALVRQDVEREMVLRLRDQVIEVDTLPSEAELEAAYRREAPGAMVQARHILLTYPQGATPAQEDSVRQLAGSLRQQLVGGADFGSLASQYSADPGSASRGGDLGSFPRGVMVASFDSAAFALEPGEISTPVESPFGLHIIRVDGKEVPSFDAVRDEFRSQYAMMKVQEAEAAYLESVEEPAGVEVSADAYGVLRELAAAPSTRLSGRAGKRALVTFAGGSFTAQDYLSWIQAQAPGLRAQVVQAPDDALEGLLRSLARERLLVSDARARGIALSAEEAAEIEATVRGRLVEATGVLGLADVLPNAGETREAAVARVVMEVLGEMLRGERDVIPLGGVSFTLRTRDGGEVRAAAVDRTVLRLQELQGEMGFQLPPGFELPPEMMGPPQQGPDGE
jgi:parvulin-like peptidyl-prolyl isomerase